MAEPVVALVSRDLRTTADVRRLCAVAGVALDVVSDPTAAVRAFRRARVVLVDVELADAVLAGLPPPGRDGVMVLADCGDRLDVWRAAALLGAGVVVLPDDERLLVDRLVAAAEPDVAPATVIGVVPGSGGAGASLLAVAMALAAARQAPAVLLDADPMAGGLDLLLGVEDEPGSRWSDLTALQGMVVAQTLGRSLPRVGELFLVSGGRAGGTVTSDAMTGVLAATRRLGGVVVADLAGAPDPAVEVIAAACERIFVVALDEVRAAASAAIVAARAMASCPDVAVVVRTRPRAQLRPAEVAAAVGLPLAGVIPTEGVLAAAADAGTFGAVALRSRLGGWACEALRAFSGRHRAA